MRILHIINDLNTGGAEVLLYKILKNSSTDDDFFIITLKEKGKIGQKIVDLGFTIYELKINRFNFLFKFIQLVNVILKFNPNVIHTWMYHSNLIGGFAAKFHRLSRIIWSIHHNDLSPSLNKKATIFIAYLGGLFSKWVPHKIICVSEKVFITHSNFGYDIQKLVIINNGVDTNEFYFNPECRNTFLKQFNFSENDYLVGFFGRFDPIKNWKGFLRSCKLLIDKSDDKNIKIIMGGSNMDSNNLELISFLDSLKIKNEVLLLGLRDDMQKILSSIDIVVNTSFNESFSLILAEAMACELLCVSTIEGDPCNIVGEIGIRKSFQSDEEIAQDIFSALIKSRKSNNSRSLARERIKSLFDLQKTIREYNQVYKVI